MATIQSRGSSGIFFALIFVALSIWAFREMRLSKTSLAVGQMLEPAVNSKYIKEYGNLELRERYTGIEGLDLGLKFLVVAFLPGVLDIDRGQKLQLAHFLLSFLPFVGIFCVEAGRTRNKWSLLYFPSLWVLLYQTIGGAVIIPLIHLAYMKTSSSTDYWTPSTRAVSLPYAKALLPSLIIGYLVPTIALFVPWNNVYTLQGFVALWQPSPLFVNILLVVMSTLFSMGQTTPKDAPEGTTADVPYLKRVYLFSFAVAAASHWLTAYLCIFGKDPNMSFWHALWPRSDLMFSTGSIKSLHEGLLYIFQIDFWIIFGSGLIWAYLAILDTNRAARSYVAPAKAITVMALNTVLFGPAATIAAIWFSRETTLASLQQKRKAT